MNDINLCRRSFRKPIYDRRKLLNQSRERATGLAGYLFSDAHTSNSSESTSSSTSTEISPFDLSKLSPD